MIARYLVWLLLVLVVAQGAVLFSRLHAIEAQSASLQATPQVIASAGREALAALATAQRTALDSLSNKTVKLQEEAGRAVSARHIARLAATLDSLGALASKKLTELETLNQERARIENSLPAPVDLDSLANYYRGFIASRSSAGQTCAIPFNTQAGRIYFSCSQIQFANIPSSGALAWVRIGKEGCTEAATLIKAWLNETVQTKLAFGYTKISERTLPAEYGDCTRILLKRGDLYCRTYFETRRMLETYGRHSLQYNFHVEVGSDRRRRQYELEQYSQKLGS